MKKIFLGLMACFTIMTQPLHAEEIPKAVFDIVPALETLAADPTLIKAVTDANAQTKTQAMINQMDADWQSFEGMSDVMTAMMTNEAAQKLLEFEQKTGYCSEIFLTDNKGANVAMTVRTSDYWQGDEAKFTEAFKGDGQVFMGPVSYDDSTEAYLVQVSIPVKADGQKAGVLVVGVNLDMLE